jgi:hypothetical protein
MSGAARFDIRIPIGILFLALGVILAIYGITTVSDVTLYGRSENIVINLWWGLVMTVFGGLMLYFGTRAGKGPVHTPAGDATENREHRLGLERE